MIDVCELMYGVCKRTIQRGGYPADMALRLGVLLGGGMLTTERYGELTAMLEV